MKNRLWLTLAIGVVLVMLTSMSTTGASWRDEATVDAGTVTTGSLVLLVGGQPTAYNFTAFNTLGGNNLAPGKAVRAPLTITNGGSADMTYGLTSVTPTAISAADDALLDALRLTVTDDSVCGGVLAGEVLLDHIPLEAAGPFGGRVLAPSSFETLCIEIALSADAPNAAAAGTTSVTFTFRGDQTS
jgi:hypothetical protein